VEDGRGPLIGPRVAQVVGQHDGRKGQERYTQEKQQVADDQTVGRSRDEAEDRVMVGPHDADGDEADEVPEIARPRVAELVRERSRSTGHTDLENEQRDRYREDAVREGF